MGSIRLFFFKQKTEDEGRISDWSSDVCSSDLVAAHVRRARAHPGALGLLAAGCPATHRAATARPHAAGLWLGGFGRRLDDRDRTSVVQGKCGAVRVVPGCRRSIHKTNNDATQLRLTTIADSICTSSLTC